MTNGGEVAVVGAGPAGLAAAWRLSVLGREVRVYEASSRVGGRLRTEEVAGRGADVPVQLVSGGYDRTRALLEDVGLGDALVPVPGRDALWRDGRAHPLRYGSVSSMVASGALPTKLKLAMGLRYLPFLERNASRLDLNDPVQAAGAGLDRESIAEWGTRQMGEAFVESLAYPLLAAYYGVTPEETSAALFHALARAGMGVEVLGARGGFGALAAAVGGALSSRGVTLRTESGVRALEGDGSGVRVVTGAGAERHAAVVLAVPAGEAARLAPLAEVPAAVRTRSTAALVLSTSRSLATGWFGLSIPRGEPPGETLAAVCVQEEKRTGVVGAGGGALVLVPSPAAGERWAEAEAAVAAREGLLALDHVLPGARDTVQEARLVRLPGSVWVPAPGWFERLASYDPRALPPWLALAGDYLVSPTVEGAVRSGIRAADRIAATSAAG